MDIIIKISDASIFLIKKFMDIKIVCYIFILILYENHVIGNQSNHKDHTTHKMFELHFCRCFAWCKLFITFQSFFYYHINYDQKIYKVFEK